MAGRGEEFWSAAAIVRISNLALESFRDLVK